MNPDNIRIETLTAEISMEDYLRDYVDVPRFYELCTQCGNFGTRWSCPPYDFSSTDFLREFSTFRVVARRISPIGDWQFDEPAEGEGPYEKIWQMLGRVKADLEADLFELENEFPGSRLVSGGSCYKCAEGCTRTSGEPCRHPEIMRYAVEALGGDVEKIAKDLLHSPIIWNETGVLPPYYMLVGGLLVK
ncbi:MAG: hypothetical protein IJS91_05965 [Bacteroidales bacterium]|nr:hypothetical protein [Bacteroidales bacterium]